MIYRFPDHRPPASGEPGTIPPPSTRSSSRIPGLSPAHRSSVVTTGQCVTTYASLASLACCNCSRTSTLSLTLSLLRNVVPFLAHRALPQPFCFLHAHSSGRKITDFFCLSPCTISLTSILNNLLNMPSLKP